jgi:2,4-didehydro-3-deoxy-L-rhamnonate hydrolase
MRFVTFRGDGGVESVGVVDRGGQVLRDLSHPALARALGGAPRSLQAMLDEGLDGWVRRIEAAGDLPEATRPLSGASLLAPLPRPGKIVGAAFNFTDALAERAIPTPKEPVTFVRSGSTVVGPGEPILIPPDVGNVGYEAELAVVIGRRALRVPRERAMEFVAGYCAHNDVSGSDLVRGDGGNFVRGKNLPASAPLGPWLVTADELADPYAVGIRLAIDGRPLQDGSTARMLFRIDELIEWISHRMPLDPGDVIATGTPAGIAQSHTPPAWLRPGATVTIELDGIGTLSNPVRAGAPFLDRQA